MGVSLLKYRSLKVLVNLAFILISNCICFKKLAVEFSYLCVRANCIRKGPNQL